MDSWLLIRLSVNGEHYQLLERQRDKPIRFFTDSNLQKEQYFLLLRSNLGIKRENKVTPVTGQRNFQGFNYQSYLASQGIYRMAQIER